MDAPGSNVWIVPVPPVGIVLPRDKSGSIGVDGDGIGAVLTSEINSSGEISSIKIVKSGADYTQSETTVSVTFPGSGVEFAPSIQNWRVNNFEKNFD